MNVLNDMHNKYLEGFFLEASGDSMTARRLNRWQWDVEFEFSNGRTYRETMRDDEVMRRAEELLASNAYTTYVPHWSSVKWDGVKVEKFMNSLAPQMCKSNFIGFTLTANNAKTFTVLHEPNTMNWYVDGKWTDFSGVLRKTRKKLEEDVYWDYQPL